MEMASNELGVAKDVVTMMSSLTAATGMAGALALTANNVSEVVADVTRKSQETLTELPKEVAKVAGADLSDFHEAIQDCEVSGKGLRQHCLELKEKWDYFEKHIRELFKQNRIGRDDVKQCNHLLQDMLQFTAKCGFSCLEFRENLRHAIDVAVRLAERCKSAAGDARSEASRVRSVGQTVDGPLKFAEAVFSQKAMNSGGNFKGAAAAGIGVVTSKLAAIILDSYINARTSKLDKLATEFDELREKLDDSLRDLKLVENQIPVLIDVTEKMTQNMEIALKFFKMQEGLMQEKEELEKQVQQQHMNEEKLLQEKEEMEKQVQQQRMNAEALRQEKEELEKQVQQLTNQRTYCRIM